MNHGPSLISVKKWACPRIGTIVLLVLVAACSDERYGKIPIPDLSEGDIVLRATHVVNPRFRQLSREQIRLLTRQAEDTVRDHFDIEIDIQMVASFSVGGLFRTLPESVARVRGGEIVNLEKPRKRYQSPRKVDRANGKTA